MREKAKIIELDYSTTKQFFNNRSLKYSEDCPYSTTMYQDGNKKLVEERNSIECSKILPLLELNNNSKVIDIACGVGRWSDAIKADIHSYIGVDFSEKLINIARERNKKKNTSYYCGSTNEIENLYCDNHWDAFNRIIMAGILIYLNDEDVHSLFDTLYTICDNDSILYLREPIAIQERLTLKDFYSDELKSEYNAIYRTRQELLNILNTSVLSPYVSVQQEGFLFEDKEGINNRKETSQYYWMLRIHKGE